MDFTMTRNSTTYMTVTMHFLTRNTSPGQRARATLYVLVALSLHGYGCKSRDFSLLSQQKDDAVAAELQRSFFIFVTAPGTQELEDFGAKFVVTYPDPEAPEKELKKEFESKKDG